ncbi:ABC-2 type transport system ATP-binding protein [Scopulibacillus daqui]|uniref:ABC-2 type transport system ATP-binding protein n=1 Tax=Scopulibacillus daqui TaxID=1469162 RepID=A0ABS2PZQ3_9BACL|nr:lantibiotic protection ABC transporter ATP-binding subunit [Scopulibacillus daqui]MBM7645205.1 ABC-2 type transport system ATP-binding protein [Scopulibacillus daqui]
MTNYILTTTHLGKKFKNETVLSDINLHVEYGEIYGLLGLNGAGKSTLMKIICGILQKTTGEIMFEGDYWKRSDLKKIGSLIEGPAIYGNLSAYDNLKLFCLQENIPFEEINQVLSKVNLTNTGKKKTKAFSLGMKQRLGIAMALIKRPKFLVLDEPANGLDPAGIRELRSLLNDLKREGITTMISSHALNEIQILSDTIGIIHNGKLEYENKIDHKENLEDLFFKITSGNRRGA